MPVPGQISKSIRVSSTSIVINRTFNPEAELSFYLKGPKTESPQWKS